MSTDRLEEIGGSLVFAARAALKLDTDASPDFRSMPAYLLARSPLGLRTRVLLLHDLVGGALDADEEIADGLRLRKISEANEAQEVAEACVSRVSRPRNPKLKDVT